MVRQRYIPDEVIDAIYKHINAATEKAINDFPSAEEEEDTFTGNLFGLLQIKDQRVIVKNSDYNGIWRWSITYNKFRSKGKSSTESILGADGIIELHIENNSDDPSVKSLLFQSKLGWKNKDNKLYQQCIKMLPWRGASTIINYTETEIETFDVDEIVKLHGKKPVKFKSIQELLGKDFLFCKIGDNDLLYNARRKILLWIDKDKNPVGVKFNIKNRLKIKIKEPKRSKFYPFKKFKQLSNDEIYKHRLDSNLEKDKINKIKTLKELSEQKVNSLHTFHPDKHSNLLESQKITLNNITQENISLLEIKKEKLKKK